jgi:hypothetical protein
MAEPPTMNANKDRKTILDTSAFMAYVYEMVLISCRAHPPGWLFVRMKLKPPDTDTLRL